MPSRFTVAGGVYQGEPDAVKSSGCEYVVGAKTDVVDCVCDEALAYVVLNACNILPRSEPLGRLTVACVQQRMYVPYTLEEYRQSLRRFLRGGREQAD